MDLSGITAAVTNRAADQGQILFSPALPDVARYAVRLDGVTDVAGNLLTGDNDRVMTALAGDANGDLNTNVFDAGTAWFYRDHDATGFADPVLPAAASHQAEAIRQTYARSLGEQVGGGISTAPPTARGLATAAAPIPTACHAATPPVVSAAQSQGGTVRVRTASTTAAIVPTVSVGPPQQTEFAPAASLVTTEQEPSPVPADVVAPTSEPAPSLDTDLADILGERLDTLSARE